nr:OsmC family peroxiredoxin [Actinomycetales bacterium]
MGGDPVIVPPALSSARASDEGLIPSPTMAVERTGRLTYVARNENGAEVRVGTESVPGTFTPGELLKIALAACNAMSAEARLVHTLGPEFDSETVIETLKHEQEERYARFRVTLTAPVQDLEEEKRDRLSERATVAVQKNCTVGRTLEAGAAYEFLLAGEGE